MTNLRSTESKRIQDARSPAQRGQSRTKAANPGLYPKQPGPKAPPRKASRSYTPSPGRSGGVWRDAHGHVIGTSKSEDSPISRIKPKANRSGGGGRKS
jgi:hypothetical protein